MAVYCNNKNNIFFTFIHSLPKSIDITAAPCVWLMKHSTKNVPTTKLVYRWLISCVIPVIYDNLFRTIETQITLIELLTGRSDRTLRKKNSIVRLRGNCFRDTLMLSIVTQKIAHQN